MEIQVTNYGNLNKRVRSRLPTSLRDNTKVLVARKGNEVAGLAAIEHLSCPKGGRELCVHLNAKSDDIEDLLVEEVKFETKHLKRRVVFS